MAVATGENGEAEKIETGDNGKQALDEDLIIENDFEHGIMVDDFCDCTCGDSHEQNSSQPGLFMNHFNKYLLWLSIIGVKLV